MFQLAKRNRILLRQEVILCVTTFVDIGTAYRLSTLLPAGTACCACAALCHSHPDCLGITNPMGRKRIDSVGELTITLLKKEFTMSKKSSLSKSKKKAKDDRPDSSSTLPGWPGYRTREGRSGYDPIDSRAEAGHMAGTILQKLFTGHIKNRLALFLLSVLGLVLVAPLVLAISEARNGNLFAWSAWLFTLVIAMLGIAILVNVIKNLLGIIRG
jgi:hypothetical protein